ncbi:hypothetical protein E2C01_058804 [Portunus trituberculatus]|uniref:Uncharacterized protein n=1 Tax=Portunus trituberculatus TaxID=210409 RepID=A0A5B7H768_PORTR|nr:hypothetical protein [Portunus trituberculatus]
MFVRSSMRLVIYRASPWQRCWCVAVLASFVTLRHKYVTLTTYLRHSSLQQRGCKVNGKVR